MKLFFYDKIRDLEKAQQRDKRTVEKDNNLQLNIFNKLKTRNKLEILRIEVRLNKRTKIKALFNTLNIKSDLTFKSLFKPTISKTILLHYLAELERNRPKLLDYKSQNDKALLSTLIFNNPELKPKQILQMFGLKKILETVNLRELRAMFSKYDQRSWYKLINEANKILLPIPDTSFKILRECLLKFKIFRFI